MSGTEPHREPHDETLRERVDRPERELADLRRQVDATATSTSTLPPGAKDYRDARVLEALDPSDIVGPGRLQERTDVREQETLRNRVTDLVERGPFETAGCRRWRYVPDGDADR